MTDVNVAQMRVPHPQRSDNVYRCPTNTSRPIQCCSSRICRRGRRAMICARCLSCTSCFNQNCNPRRLGGGAHAGCARRHAGLLEIRTIPAKKDIAFVEFSDEGAASIAKDALHNFKIDGETKMKVCRPPSILTLARTLTDFYRSLMLESDAGTSTSIWISQLGRSGVYNADASGITRRLRQIM